MTAAYQTSRFERIAIDFPIDTPILAIKEQLRSMGWRKYRVRFGHDDTVRVIRRKS